MKNLYKFSSPIYVTRAFLPPLNEYVEMLKSIWDTAWVTNNGPYHVGLEEKLKKFLKVNNGTLFTNGHLALDIAIKSLGLKGEVITTPFTFSSTTHAIVLNNLNPVFCDINPKDFTIDVSKIEELITNETCAIIPVHVYGYPCDVSFIDEISKKYNLKVIYDAAHAFGVEVNGNGIGNFGDISMFSLHATKIYNSIEGGFLTFTDPITRHVSSLLKNFGISGYETVDIVGLNAKMSEFQAAMGILNLNYLQEQIEKRKTITDIYRKELSDINGIYFHTDEPGIKYNYAYFPIVLDENICGITRDELYEKLKELNIFTRKYFFPLTTDFSCYKGRYKDDHLINSKVIAKRVLTLPLYGQLGIEDAQKIANNIKVLILENQS